MGNFISTYYYDKSVELKLEKIYLENENNRLYYNLALLKEENEKLKSQIDSNKYVL